MKEFFDFIKGNLIAIMLVPPAAFLAAWAIEIHVIEAELMPPNGVIAILILMCVAVLASYYYYCHKIRKKS